MDEVSKYTPVHKNIHDILIKLNTKSLITKVNKLRIEQVDSSDIKMIEDILQDRLFREQQFPNEEEETYVNENNFEDERIEQSDYITNFDIRYKKMLEFGLSQQQKFKYKILFQKLVSELQKDISLREIRDYLFRHYLDKSKTENISLHNQEMYALSHTEMDINFLYSYFDKYYETIDNVRGELKLRLKKEYTYECKEDIRDLTIKIRKEQLEYVKPLLKSINNIESVGDNDNIEIVFDKEYDTYKKKYFITEEEKEKLDKSKQQKEIEKKEAEKTGEYESSKKEKKDIRKVLTKDEYDNIENKNVIYQKRNNSWNYISKILEEGSEKPETYYNIFKQTYNDTSIIKRANESITSDNFIEKISSDKNNYFLDQNSSIEANIKQSKSIYKFNIVISEIQKAEGGAKEKKTKSKTGIRIDKEAEIKQEQTKVYPENFYIELKKYFFKNIKDNISGKFYFNFDGGIYEIEYTRTGIDNENIDVNSRILGSINRVNFLKDDHTQYQLSVDYELKNLFGSYNLKVEKGTLYPVISRLVETYEDNWVFSESVNLTDIEVSKYTHSFKEKNVKDIKDKDYFKNCYIEFEINEKEKNTKILYGVIIELNSSFMFNIMSIEKNEKENIKFIEHKGISVDNIRKIWKKPIIYKHETKEPILIENEIYSFIYPDPNVLNSKGLIKTCNLISVYTQRPPTIEKYDMVFVDKDIYNEFNKIPLFNKLNLSFDFNNINIENPLLKLYSNTEGRTYYISYKLFEFVVCNVSKSVNYLNILYKNKDINTKNPIIKIDKQLYVLGNISNPNLSIEIENKPVITLDDIIIPIEPLIIYRTNKLINKIIDSVENINKDKENVGYNFIKELINNIKGHYDIHIYPLYTSFFYNNYIYNFNEKDIGTFDEYQSKYLEMLNEIYTHYKTIEDKEQKNIYKKHIYLIEYVIESINDIYYYIKFETMKNENINKKKKSKKMGGGGIVDGNEGEGNNIIKNTNIMKMVTTLNEIEDLYEDIDIENLNKTLSLCNDNNNITNIYTKLPTILNLLHQLDSDIKNTNINEKNLLSLKIMNDLQFETLIKKFGYHSPKVYTYQLLQTLYNYNQYRYYNFMKRTYIPYPYDDILDFNCNDIKYDKKKLLLFYNSINNLQNKTIRYDLLNKFLDNYAILISLSTPQERLIYKIPYRDYNVEISKQNPHKKLDYGFIKDTNSNEDLEICIHTKYLVSGLDDKYNKLKNHDGICINCGEQIGDIEYDTQENFADDENTENATENTRENSNLLGNKLEGVGIQTYIKENDIDEDENILSNFAKQDISKYFVLTIINKEAKEKAYFTFDAKKEKIYTYLNDKIILQNIKLKEDGIEREKQLLIFNNYQNDFDNLRMRYNYIAIRNNFMIPFFIEYLSGIHKDLFNIMSDLLLLFSIISNTNLYSETELPNLTLDNYSKQLKHNKYKGNIINIIKYLYKTDTERIKFVGIIIEIIKNYISKEFILNCNVDFMEKFMESILNLNKNNLLPNSSKTLTIDPFFIENNTIINLNSNYTKFEKNLSDIIFNLVL